MKNDIAWNGLICVDTVKRCRSVMSWIVTVTIFTLFVPTNTAPAPVYYIIVYGNFTTFMLASPLTAHHTSEVSDVNFHWL